MDYDSSANLNMDFSRIYNFDVNSKDTWAARTSFGGRCATNLRHPGGRAADDGNHRFCRSPRLLRSGIRNAYGAVPFTGQLRQCVYGNTHI
jgi:hypothetical protein